jgi:hypothetical protein
MRKVLLIAILLVGSLASAGALDFQALSVGGRRIVALARDDGRYANSPLKSWFDRLASGNGLCCSFADGFRVDDVDWDTQDSHYRVRLNGEWIVVPDDAVVTEPNKYGPPLSGPTWAPTGKREFAASFLAQACKHGQLGPRVYQPASGRLTPPSGLTEVTAAVQLFNFQWLAQPPGQPARQYHRDR